MVDKHYVYKHVGKGEVVYIGKGTKERAWSSHTRSPQHKQWMKDCDIFTAVQPIETDLTEKEAILLERTLIYELQPKFNVGLKGGAHGNNAKLDYDEILAIKTLLYPSGLTQKEIANMFETSQGYISNIITGRIWGYV